MAENSSTPDDPSLSEEARLGLESEGTAGWDQPAPVVDQNIARRLTITPDHAEKISKIRLEGRVRRQQGPLPLCEEGFEVLDELRKNRRADPLTDLMDRSISLPEEEDPDAPGADAAA